MTWARRAANSRFLCFCLAALFVTLASEILMKELGFSRRLGSLTALLAQAVFWDFAAKLGAFFWVAKYLDGAWDLTAITLFLIGYTVATAVLSAAAIYVHDTASVSTAIAGTSFETPWQALRTAEYNPGRLTILIAGLAAWPIEFFAMIFILKRLFGPWNVYRIKPEDVFD